MITRHEDPSGLRRLCVGTAALIALSVAAGAWAAPSGADCGKLNAAYQAARNQQNAITSAVAKNFFTPQMSLDAKACLKSLMSTHLGFGSFGFNLSSILGDLENQACAAAEGEESNLTSQIGQNLQIPGAHIGGAGSPLYVPGAGASANIDSGAGSNGPVSINGSTVSSGTSWKQIQSEIFQ
ncbi:MAG: hypothetical protein ACYDHY_13115 [Acidiferrobacterales bacterium]